MELKQNELLPAERPEPEFNADMTHCQCKEASKYGQNKISDADLMLKDSHSDKQTMFYTNKDGQTVPCINDAKSIQFFVKVFGSEVSMHEDLNTMTVKMLMESACQKIGIKAHDLYATFWGKQMDDDKRLSCYPIYKDSTIDVRHRLRAGRRQEIDCKTFDEKIKTQECFHEVTLSPTLINQTTQKGRAIFLSSFAQYIARQVLISLCRKHYRGKSFNGAFSAEHILFYDGRVIFDNTLEEVDFDAASCQNDYSVIANIYQRAFYDDHNKQLPLFVDHLLTYLLFCPAKASSNSEPAIAYLTNHPSLTSYKDRMSQCTTLDKMVNRLDHVHYKNFVSAIGKMAGWSSKVSSVPAMKITFEFGSTCDPVSHGVIARYQNTKVGCLHFSRNFFEHAGNQLKLEEIEAAFAVNMETFLPDLLQNIAIRFKGPAEFDIVKLLGDNIADKDKDND